MCAWAVAGDTSVALVALLLVLVLVLVVVHTIVPAFVPALGVVEAVQPSDLGWGLVLTPMPLYCYFVVAIA